MGDFIDMILRNLAHETIDLLDKMEDRSESEVALDIAQRQKDKLDGIALDNLKEEIEAMVRYEAKEKKYFGKLLVDAEVETILAKELCNSLVPASGVSEIEKNLESYKKLTDKYVKVPKFDVCGLNNQYLAIQEQKKEIAAIEKTIAKYAALPPGVNQAQDAIETLEEEIKALEVAAERKVIDDVSQYYS